jgi:hypothetical protein
MQNRRRPNASRYESVRKNTNISLTPLVSLPRVSTINDIQLLAVRETGDIGVTMTMHDFHNLPGFPVDHIPILQHA